MKFDNKDKFSIQKLFNQIACNYDNINNLISFGMHKIIKKNAVRFLNKYVDSKNEIIDLCTGTGDIALLLKEFYPDSNVTAVDFSANMLEIAKKRSNEIIFLNEDITDFSLEFKSKLKHQCYNIAFISFGLRNLSNIESFLLNVKTLLARGAVLSVLDFGKPIFIAKIYSFLHFNILVPFIAKIFSKDITPYKYFSKSVEEYASPKELTALFEKKGYEVLAIKYYAFGFIVQHILKNKN